MKVIVLGYGLIGRERVKALCDLRKSTGKIDNIYIFDPYISGRDTEKSEIIWLDNYEDINNIKPDWIVIATPHDTAVDLAKKMIPLGSHILMEKPFCRSYEEASNLASMVSNEDQIWVGFNYRFFPGIAQAIHDTINNRFGDIISVNIVLGHGGAPGNETSWKLNPIRAGGGCLLDPGIHLIDLCLLLSPEKLIPVKGLKWDGFWDTGIEEEVHLLFEADKFIINLQVSIVRWASTFRLEINGKEGYGIVSGRGKSYGNQVYTRGRRWGWLAGKSQSQTEERVIETDCSNSFKDEFEALFWGKSKYFLEPCSLKQALLNMKTYEYCKNILYS